jgi:hypothetical protein
MAAEAPTGQAPTSSTITAITTGSFTWGFKESFRLYVGESTGISAAGGASVDKKGVATFPVSAGTFDSATNSTDLAFAGSVKYRAHCEAGLGLPAGQCALDMTFSQMKIAITPDDQTLYAHVVSRQMTAGYPMKDYGVIAVATLGIQKASVTTTGGTTTWSGVSETSTAAATEATTYAAGTPLDTTSFSYRGTGGKPTSGEKWTPPGTTVLANATTWTSPTLQNGPWGLFVDDKNGTIDVANASTSFNTAMPAVSALSSGALSPVGTATSSLASASLGAGNYAFDPASGTVFYPLANADGSSYTIMAARWNAASKSYQQSTVDSSAFLLAGLAWDSALNALVTVTYDADTADISFSRWSPVGGAAAPTIWTRIDAPAPAAPAGYDPFGYYTPATNNAPPLAALSDGSLILTRAASFGDIGDANPAPLHITLSGAMAKVEEVQGATIQHGAEATAGEAAWVVAGPDGRFVVGSSGSGWSQSFVRFGRVVGGTVTMDATRTVVATPSEEQLIAAFDPTDGSVWVKGIRSGTLVGLKDGKVIASGVFQNTAQSATLAIGADHTIYTGGRTQDVHATVVRIDRVGPSPSIRTQPSSTSVANGKTAIFTAAATGTPTPTVQWQQQALGAEKFTVLAGATRASLSVAASDGVNGTKYRAVFTNAAGAIATSAATLKVATAPAKPVTPPTTGGTAGSGGVGASGGSTVAGSLSWGVKSSFRSYITGPIASGWVAVSGGASANGSGYSFPQSTGSTWTAAAGTGSGNYRGAVQFYGHGGVLDVTLSNPSVRIDSASRATLFASDNGSGPIGIGSVDLSKASVTKLPGGVSYSNAPVSLTGAGVGVFSYGSSQFYSAGQAMDPVTFTIGAANATSAGGTGSGSVKVASATKKWSAPATPPSSTGITVTSGDPTKLTAGATVSITASGFQPGEKDVRLVVYSTPRILADDLTADSSGTVSWTGALPADLTGKHTLTLQGSVNRGVELMIQPASTVGQCTVAGGTLDWGFKESFRAYIQSTIANGSWKEANGATYTVPNFGWPNGTGSFNPTTGAGLVKYTGSVNFTGHDGALNTTIANPQLQIVDDKTAYVLLDVSGPTMDGTPTNFEGASFVKLDLGKGTVKHDEDGSITATNVPTTLTADGSAAFPNYPAGSVMDPISFTLPANADCGKPVAVAQAPTEAKPTPAASSVDTPAANSWWLLWVGIAVALAAAIALFFLLRRRRGANSAEVTE